MPINFMPNTSNKNKPTKKPFIRTLALTSLLLPLLSVPQGMAYAAQSMASEPTVIVTAVSPKQTNAAKQRLMAKLGKLAFFSANFSQKILTEQGELLQEGTGNFAISKPNLVNWQTVTPDETLIVSDGNTLWFYDPFIEQVSAYSLAKSIHNTPILLLTSDAPQLWQQYTVAQDSDVALQTNNQNVERFIVTPKDNNSQIKRLTISFTSSLDTSTDIAGTNVNNNTQLSEFSFQDATGQISQISLSNFNSKVKPKASLFTFNLPQGVRLEDKR